MNLYGYANGDPINFSDPFGLSPCEDEGNEIECAAAFLVTLRDLKDRLDAWRAEKNQSEFTRPEEVRAKEGYELAWWQNALHQNGGSWDTKMVLPDGRFSSKEFIFDGDTGALITGSAGGTYNIVNPLPPGRGTCADQIACYGEALRMYASWIAHAVLDIAFQ